MDAWLTCWLLQMCIAQKHFAFKCVEYSRIAINLFVTSVKKNIIISFRAFVGG